VAIPYGTLRHEERRRSTSAPRMVAGVIRGARNERHLPGVLRRMARAPLATTCVEGSLGIARGRFGGMESLPDRPDYELAGTLSTAARTRSSTSAARRASSFPPWESQT